MDINHLGFYNFFYTNLFLKNRNLFLKNIYIYILMYTTRKIMNKKINYSKKYIRRKIHGGATHNNPFRPYINTSNFDELKRSPDEFINAFIIKNYENIEEALKELKEGKKETHWIWYIFPQPLNVFDNRGTPTEDSLNYSFNSKEEAFKFIENKRLVMNYRECLNTLLNTSKTKNKKIKKIMGGVDFKKLISSVKHIKLTLEVYKTEILKGSLLPEQQKLLNLINDNKEQLQIVNRAHIVTPNHIAAVNNNQPQRTLYVDHSTPRELRDLYSEDKYKFPEWILNYYDDKEKWSYLYNKIKEPIPTNLKKEEKEYYKKLLVNRQTCNIEMNVYDKRENYKSAYERMWLQSLGLNEQEIDNWPDMPVTTTKTFGEGILPLNVMVMNNTPMKQARWEEEKYVNIINLIGYGFDSYLQPDYQRYYLSDMKVEDGRKLIKLLNKGDIVLEYEELKKRKYENLNWKIEVTKTFEQELIDLYLDMYKKACKLAIINGMKAIFFAGVGAGAFGPPGIGESEFNEKIRDIVFQKLITDFEEKIEGGGYDFRGKYKDLLVFDKFRVDTHSSKERKNPEPNYYIKGRKDKFLTSEDNFIKTIYRKKDSNDNYKEIFDTIKDLKGNEICYINAWDPHSIAGNGNSGDNSLDGYIGANSAISLLSWPPTNPVLAEKVGYTNDKNIPNPFYILTLSMTEDNIETKLITNTKKFELVFKQEDYFDIMSDKPHILIDNLKYDIFKKKSSKLFTSYISKSGILISESSFYQYKYKVLNIYKPSNTEIVNTNIRGGGINNENANIERNNENAITERPKKIRFNNRERVKFITEPSNNINNSIISNDADFIKNFFEYKGLKFLQIDLRFDIKVNTSALYSTQDLQEYFGITESLKSKFMNEIIDLDADVIIGFFDTLFKFNKNNKKIKEKIDIIKANGTDNETEIFNFFNDPIEKLKSANYTYSQPKNISDYTNEIYHLIFYKKDKLECKNTEIIEIKKINSEDTKFISVITEINSKIPYSSSNLNKQSLHGILKTRKNNIPNIEDFRVGTSKKNDYYKPKSDSLYEKMKSYLNQCNRIKKAYKEKHREIQRIYDYVKKLYESRPDIPIKDANINEIIQYLENNIKIEDIEKKHIELDKKRREQNIWKVENENIYKELMKRLKKMKK